MTSSTERLYYRDSYLREFTARVVRMAPAGEMTEVVLERTAFYRRAAASPQIWAPSAVRRLPA